MNDPRTAFEKRVLELAREGRVPSPTLVMSRDIIVEKLQKAGQGIPGAMVYYAAKANDNLEVLRAAATTGVGFEVASQGEIEKLASIGVSPDRIITSNPIKRIEFISFAWNFGIKIFAFDSVDEVDKLVQYAPGCEGVLRIYVENDTAEWPLSGKFGAPVSATPEILKRAQELGLNVVGVNFHVGSQCTTPRSWDSAIQEAKKVFDYGREYGFEFDLINMGGGYPATYFNEVPTAADIEGVAKESLARHLPNVKRIFIEPGRYVAGDAGIYVSKVIGKAVRADGQWIFIDVGVFNGLTEAIGGIRYRTTRVKDGGEEKKVILAGPSCDGFDIIDKNTMVVEPEIGDLVLLHTTGAYTTVYAGNFNGFAMPPVKILEETWPM